MRKILLLLSCFVFFPSYSFASGSLCETKIDAFIVEDIQGVSDSIIPLKIDLDGELGPKSMLLFRGIPKEVSLNLGIKKENIWSVSAKDVNSAAFVVPKGFYGRFDIEIFAFAGIHVKRPLRRVISLTINKSLNN